jgi:hypothetical protein
LSSKQPDSLDAALEQRALQQGWKFKPAFGQPAPKQINAAPSMWPMVMKDMTNRDRFGIEKYGVGLKAHNGRDPLQDAYEEALDLCVYLRQALYERNGK